MRLRLSDLSKNFSRLDRLAKEQLQKVLKKGLEATPEEVKASRPTPGRIRRLNWGNIYPRHDPVSRSQISVNDNSKTFSFAGCSPPFRKAVDADPFYIRGRSSKTGK